jgi:hypothetical protein
LILLQFQGLAALGRLLCLELILRNFVISLSLSNTHKHSAAICMSGGQGRATNLRSVDTDHAGGSPLAVLSRLSGRPLQTQAAAAV